MLSEETKKELEETIQEINTSIEDIRNMFFSNKRLSHDTWMLLQTRSSGLTNKVDKLTKKIEKEQGYDKARN